MATENITPTAIHSECGCEFPTTCTDRLIDGDTSETYLWRHLVNEQHWVIFDLGETREVVGVRVYIPNGGLRCQWNSADVRVGDDPGSLTLATPTNIDFSNGPGWVEKSIGALSGRYVKLEDIDTENANDYIDGYEVEIVVTAAAGWSGKVMGVTDPAKICGVAVADIAKVMGIE